MFYNARNNQVAANKNPYTKHWWYVSFGKLIQQEQGFYKWLRIHTTNLSAKKHFDGRKSTLASWIREIAEECETIDMNYDKP